MPRHMEDPHRDAGDLAQITFLQQAVAPERLDFQLKPVPAKKRGVGHHRSGVGMVGHMASVPPLDFCGIRHMIEVPVREQKRVNFLPGEIFVRPLGSVKQEVAPGCFKEKRVGIQRPAGERFELIHD